MLPQCTALARPPCGPGQCLNTAGGYSCLCPAGYSSSNNTCTDIDEVGSGHIFVKLGYRVHNYPGTRNRALNYTNM